MSREGSQKSNNSHSESSSSSPSQTPFFQEHIFKNHANGGEADLTLFGSPAPTFIRSGTIRRANSLSLKREKISPACEKNISEEKENIVGVTPRLERVNSFEQHLSGRYRRSLDSTFRRSLESISEHKTKRSFSPTFSLSRTSKYSSSLESFSSDQTDYATRSPTTGTKDEKTLQSPASSYLSWIETVNSEFFESACSESNDFDNKVGEWNNFWLNYNSARNPYLSSPYHRSADEKTGDDISETRDSGSTQKDITDRNSTEYISLSFTEIHEVLKCSKTITDILQNALTRNDHDCDNSNMENSTCEMFTRHNSSLKEENRVDSLTDDLRKLSKERSLSYYMSSQDLIKPKELLKPTGQSSSTSCINALLTTGGVADILKKVINKRREVITPDDVSSMTRHSFSEWSSK